MTALKVRRSSRELARRHLEAIGNVPGVRSAVLVSEDGFEIASHAADPATAARLAAIASSMSALGAAISADAALADFERTTVECSGGTVTIMRVSAQSPMSVAVVASSAATLGQLLWATRHCCAQLGRLLQE